MKKVGVIAISIAIALLTGCSSGPQYATKVTDNEQTNVTEDTSESVKAEHYSKAADLAAKGNYAEAIEEYTKADGYSDAKEKIFEIYCSQAEKALAEDKYEEAISNYQKAGEYKDVSDKIHEIYYVQGDKAYADGKLDKAISCFKNAATYKDASSRRSDIAYNCAVQALKDKNNKLAASYYKDAGDYKDAREQANKLYYSIGVAALKNKNYEEGAQALQSAGGYPAAIKLFDNTIKTLIAQKDYDTARKMSDYCDSAVAAGLKNYIQGRKAYNENDYLNAIVAFEKSGKTLDSSLYLNASNYFLGIKALNNKDYKTAQQFFEKGGNYKNSKVLLNVCAGESYIQEKNYEAAVKYYNQVPKNLKVKGINISARKALMSRVSAFSKIRGYYSVKSNRIQTTNVKKSNKRKYWWYLTSRVDSQHLTLDYSVNDNGTINLHGTVSYYHYINCSTLRDSIRGKYETVNFTIRNLKSIPKKATIARYVKLKYKKGMFSLAYKEKDNYSIYYYNIYQTTVNFKKTGIKIHSIRRTS